MSNLHPWLSELSEAETRDIARRAIRIAYAKIPAGAGKFDYTELEAEAFELLLQCATPYDTERPTECFECGEPLGDVRPGALFCSEKCGTRNRVRAHRAEKKGAPVARVEHLPQGHVGSMFKWPEDQRRSYAIREVGLRLCHVITLATTTGEKVSNVEDVEIRENQRPGTHYARVTVEPIGSNLNVDPADEYADPVAKAWYQFRAVKRGCPGYLSGPEWLATHGGNGPHTQVDASGASLRTCDGALAPESRYELSKIRAGYGVVTTRPIETEVAA